MGGMKQQVRPWSSYIWCAQSAQSLSRKFSLIKSRDTWNKSPEERQFLQRLDTCLITYATLSYFSKYLDQHNIIVSIPCYARQSQRAKAMRTSECLRIWHERRVSVSKSSTRFASSHGGSSLLLHGNQLNYITTSWTVGYVIGQIPSKLALFWPSFALPHSIQYDYYAHPTVDMGQLVIA